jgi:hypothetical protein
MESEDGAGSLTRGAAEDAGKGTGPRRRTLSRTTRVCRGGAHGRREASRLRGI